MRENGIESFLSLKLSKQNNIVLKYQNPLKFFPKSIIAFAENGGGDYICFDYRHDFFITNPPILLWCREKEENNGLSDIASNFEEFLKMLKEPED